MNSILIIVGVFILSFILTRFIRKWAIKRSIIDHPNERSSHTIPTPRGGGLAIVISWFLGISILYITNHIEAKFFWALAAGLPLPLVGFLDDIYNLKPSIRSLVQILSATTGLIILGGLKILDLGFININWIWILSPLAVIGIVWSINLFNFLDGTDGYCSMEVIFLGIASIFLVSYNLVLGVLIASVVGFLIWNWPKAKVFMGDVGSTFLGYNIAILAIYYQNTNSLSLITFLIISSVFWFDATLTLIRRKKNKENLSIAHRKHVFQRIVQAGFSHLKLLFWQLSINVLLLSIAFISIKQKEYSLLWLLISLIILFILVKLVDRKKPFDYDLKNNFK